MDVETLREDILDIEQLHGTRAAGMLCHERDVVCAMPILRIDLLQGKWLVRLERRDMKVQKRRNAT